MVSRSRGKKTYSYFRQRPVIVEDVDVNRTAKSYQSTRPPTSISQDHPAPPPPDPSDEMVLWTEAGEDLLTETGETILTED